MEYILIFITAIFVNNVVLSQFLGICPFLGVSKKVETATGMGAAVAFVLVIATIVTYLVQKYVLDAFGLQYLQTIAFILIIAALVQMVMQAFVPGLYATLGLFIPLIVVNCLILGRAEAFAAKNGPVASMFDGIGMGLGFTIALTILGGVREFLGTGKLFDIAILPEEYGMLLFVLAPGAFIALGYLIAIVNKLKKA